jgi:hypothetical protein
MGLPVVKNPDLELVPSGGFNPASSPPGLPTTLTAENVFYIGQLDLVARVSRVHSVWIDTGASAPDHIDPLIEAETGDASAVLVEFRGATGFSSEAGAAAYDATRLDAYGETFFVDPAGDRQPLGTVSFWNGDPTWAADVDELDGARFLQLRLSLVNDIDTGRSPELAGIGLAFLE